MNRKDAKEYDRLQVLYDELEKEAFHV